MSSDLTREDALARGLIEQPTAEEIQRRVAELTAEIARIEAQSATTENTGVARKGESRRKLQNDPD